VKHRLLWPLLWLVGFRVKEKGGTMTVKIPSWIPEKERQRMANRIAEGLADE